MDVIGCDSLRFGVTQVLIITGMLHPAGGITFGLFHHGDMGHGELLIGPVEVSGDVRRGGAVWQLGVQRGANVRGLHLEAGRIL